MELQLREHQQWVIEALRDGFKAGHRVQLLYAPTGFGKTEVAISLMKATADNFKRTSMILDRIVLIDQTSLRLSKYKISHGVFQANHWKEDATERIQICSAQTLERRNTFPDIDLLIVDECFTEDTLISTPSGLKEISSVRCGDIVYNSVGVGVVEAVSIKPTIELYELEFDDGTITKCTGNHPFFTERGWVKASQMEVGGLSFSEKGLRLLWESIQTKDEGGLGENSFFNELDKLAAPVELLNILLKEAEEPNAQSRISFKDEDEVKRNQTQTYNTWRERVLTSFTAVGIASCARRGVGGRIVGADSHGTLQRDLSESLQDRPSKQRNNDWDRAGWRESRISRKEVSGQQENGSSYFPRLVNISHIKRESPVPVYNIQVSGHPSYFANGKLVHNCHISRAKITELILNHPTLKVIGLTATPFTKGLGNIYSHVICAATTNSLVEKSWLAPLKVFIAKEIDMTGVKKVAGEWSPDQVTERGMQITGDIVQEWQKKTYEIYGGSRKTIVFCAGVAHGADLVRQFANKGYNFVSISYLDDDEYKRQVIEDFAKPDTEINGLIATDILTRGFDVSDVMIGVSARPFSKSFASHVQQMGRVMRPHEGKEFALWLCHSGNFLRFRNDWDQVFTEGVKSLDDREEKTKKEPTEKEKIDQQCPKCHALWARNSDHCHACGYEKPKRQISAMPGELVELGHQTRSNFDDKQLFYSELIYLAEQKNYNTNWASHKYREKFGVWPRGLLQTARPPSLTTLNWIRHKNIAYAKSKRNSNEI